MSKNIKGAIFLIIIQAIIYIATFSNGEKMETNDIGTMIGENFFIIVAIWLFIKEFTKRKDEK